MIKRFIFIFIFVYFSFSSLFATQEYHYDVLGRIPVLYNGRLQPFESFARQMLISIREKSTIKRVVDGKSVSIPASMWLWEVLTHTKYSMADPIFLIHDRDIRHEFKYIRHPDTEIDFNIDFLCAISSPGNVGSSEKSDCKAILSIAKAAVYGFFSSLVVSSNKTCT